MTKNFKLDEVMIQKKVQLKRDLKELKSGEDRKAELLTMKISQIEEKLHSRPLSKN